MGFFKGWLFRILIQPFLLAPTRLPEEYRAYTRRLLLLKMVPLCYGGLISFSQWPKNLFWIKIGSGRKPYLGVSGGP